MHMRLLLPNYLTLLIFSLVLSASTEAFGQTIYQATYKGEHSGMNVTITRTLRQVEQNSYEFSLIARALPGNIKEVSRFSVDGNAMIPAHYHYRQKVFGFGRSRELTFDWDKLTATYKKGNKVKKVHTVEPGDLEQSIYQIQLIKDLYHGKEDLHYRFVKKNKIKDIRFSIVTKESEYSLMGQSYRAWIIEVQRPPEDKRITRFTVIPDLMFQLAEITQVEKDGTSYTAFLTELSMDNAQLENFFGSNSLEDVSTSAPKAVE